MTNNIQLEKIDKFFQKEFIAKFSKILIIKNNDNSYELFDKYLINKQDNFYILSMKHTFLEKKFMFLKNAVIWCIFDNKNKIMDSSRVENLDKLLYSSNLSIDNFQRLIKSTKDVDNKLVYIAKMSQEKSKKLNYLKELKHFVNQSKIWQNKQFAINNKF